jgi:hypothetical protein
MKVVFCLFACFLVCYGMPQREGAAFTNDAIRQAQSSHLIPADAQIQNVRYFLVCLCLIAKWFEWFSVMKVQEGIELAAYENIPGGQRIDLAQILGAEVPAEVISNLQGQIDGVGRF